MKGSIKIMNKALIGFTSSPLGQIAIVVQDEKVIQLYFTESDEKSRDSSKIINKTKQWLKDYFAGKNPVMDIPVAFHGTPFQEIVWNTLLTIPYGKTMSYQEVGTIVARKMGKERMSAQAIGQAVGKNPIPLLIPCHRVIGKDGSLVGFGCGLERKVALLKLEQF